MSQAPTPLQMAVAPFVLGPGFRVCACEMTGRSAHILVWKLWLSAKSSRFSVVHSPAVGAVFSLLQTALLMAVTSLSLTLKAKEKYSEEKRCIPCAFFSARQIHFVSHVHFENVKKRHMRYNMFLRCIFSLLQAHLGRRPTLNNLANGAPRPTPSSHTHPEILLLYEIDFKPSSFNCFLVILSDLWFARLQHREHSTLELNLLAFFIIRGRLNDTLWSRGASRTLKESRTLKWPGG